MNTNGNTIKKSKMKYDIEELNSKIIKNNIIIFAFEDCLTLTNVLKKHDLIRILEKKVKNKYKINSIYDMRIKALDSIEDDITIDKIYSVLEKNLKDNTTRVKQEEINIFNKFSETNSYIKKAFDFAQENYKNIYIINNTIYDDQVVADVLERIKVSGYNDIISYNQINEFDSISTLYIIPKRDEFRVNDKSNNKVKAYIYNNPLENKNIKIDRKYNVDESIIKAIQYNKLYCGDEISFFEKFGIMNISTIYYYFVNWLYENTNGLDNLFFLSRDGYIPEKIYQMFKEKNNNNIYTKYILASRKAYQIPGLILVNEEKAIKTVTEWNMQLNEKVNLKEILGNCSLTPTSELMKIASKYGIKDSNMVITLSNVTSVKEFLKEIYPQIKEQLMKRYELTKDYLKNEGLDNFARINVMDIGWRGSVQNYMQKILNKDVYGYYFGTMVTEYKEIRKKMKGCFTNKFMPIGRSEFLLDNIMMFEIIFSAPFPALAGFEKDVNNNVVPVFSSKSKKKANDIIDTFQNAAVDIIKEYIKYEEELKNLTVDFALEEYKKFLKERDYDDILEFRNLETNLGYGEKQQSYVLETTKKELLKNTKDILEKSNFSFWKGTIYIEGIESKEEYETFKKKHNLKLKRNRFTSNRIIRSIIITTKNMKKRKKK